MAVASDRALDLEAMQASLAQRAPGWVVFSGEDLAAWYAGSPILRDDYAPVDQLLTPYPEV